MKRIELLLIAFVFIFFLACEEDDEINTNPDFRLEFSTDTLAFDTLFTSFGSTTKQLKVYNRSTKIAQITSLGLQKNQSEYRLNINGVEANHLDHVEIGARDSIYIFVEVNLLDKDQDQSRLVSDHIQFEINDNLQKVVLETHAQDVYRVNKDIVANSVWTASRPYVVTAPVWITQDISLEIQAGARVHFKKEAGLHFRGNLFLNGSFEKPVCMESIRLEEVYEEAPGQWDGLYFYPESDEINMTHFIIKNGKSGISVDRGNLKSEVIEIAYGQISNFSEKALHLSNSNVIAHDLLLTNCGGVCLSLEGIGNYQIAQSTIYNYWFYSPRSFSSAQFDMNAEAVVHFSNSIVVGSKSNELLLGEHSTPVIQNSLLKLSTSKQSEYENYMQNCLFNEDPLFVNASEFNFTLTENSPAIDKGKVEIATLYSLDLLQHQRNLDDAPDMGAYEFFEEED